MNRLRRILNIINISAAVFFALLIISMLGFIAHRHNIRFDMTKSGINTLSEKTVCLLKNIDKTMNIYVIFDPANIVYTPILRLLEQYSAQNNKIAVQLVDPDKDITRLKLIAQKTKFADRNCMIISYKDKIEVIRDTDVAVISGGDAKGAYRRIIEFSGEEALSSAILKLIEDISSSVYFTTGHGEKIPDSTQKDEMGHASIILKRQNIDVKTIDLLKTSSVPPDCALLIIAGPKTVFSEEEIIAVNNYLNNGGSALMLMDPMIYTGLENVLIEKGIVVGKDIVIDPSRKIPLVDISNLYIENFNPEHTATSRIIKSATIHPLARSVNPNPLSTGYKVEVLCATTENGWGETEPADSPVTFDKDKDREGPVPICVSSTSQNRKFPMRLVVVGDSDFCSNSQIANRSNADLFANLTNWCLNKTKILSIEAKKPEDTKLLLNLTQLRTVRNLCVFALPGISALFAFIAWLNRRK
ncbi:GldG family protein [bacterium]|nr:GldG family protein [bacterium]